MNVPLIASESDKRLVEVEKENYKMSQTDLAKRPRIKT